MHCPNSLFVFLNQPVQEYYERMFLLDLNILAVQKQSLYSHCQYAAVVTLALLERQVIYNVDRQGISAYNRLTLIWSRCKCELND